MANSGTHVSLTPPQRAVAAYASPDAVSQGHGSSRGEGAGSNPDGLYRPSPGYVCVLGTRFTGVARNGTDATVCYGWLLLFWLCCPTGLGLDPAH